MLSILLLLILIHYLYILLLLFILIKANAFTPAGRMNVKSSSLKMGFEKEIGAQPPLGFWDPLGWYHTHSSQTIITLSLSLLG